MKPVPAPFATAINALNREREFSPNSKAAEQDPAWPYWFQLRKQADFGKTFFSTYCIPPESEYRKAQGAFIQTLQDLVENCRQLAWNWDLCLKKHPDMKLAIARFVGRQPRLRFEPLAAGPSLSEGRSTFVRFGPLYEIVLFRTGTDRPTLRARRHAIRLFIALAWHPQCNQLGRCVRCNRYFFGRPGQKCCPRPRRCGSYRAAIEATKRKWRDERRQKLDRAKAEWAEWERRKPSRDWKLWVADRIGVTPKWVTRAVNSGELTPPLQARRVMAREVQKSQREEIKSKGRKTSEKT